MNRMKCAIHESKGSEQCLELQKTVKGFGKFHRQEAELEIIAPYQASSNVRRGVKTVGRTVQCSICLNFK